MFLVRLLFFEAGMSAFMPGNRLLLLLARTSGLEGYTVAQRFVHQYCTVTC